MPDPVFIVGHWRSGTTLLANLMSFDEAWFFPTMIEAISPHDFFPSPLEKLSRRILPYAFPETRPVDRAQVPLRKPFPQEDEMALAALGAPSFYNALYFPRAARLIIAREVFFEGLSDSEVGSWRAAQEGFLRKLALLHPGKQPLIRNPAHGARLQLLAETYPKARFILVRRDNCETLASMRRLFEQLWPMLALQNYDPDDIPSLVDDLQDRMLTRIERGWPQLPESTRYEIAYRELVAEPLQQVQKVHEWLGKPLTPAHALAIGEYMAENHGAKIRPVA